jgi:protease-4
MSKGGQIPVVVYLRDKLQWSHRIIILLSIALLFFIFKSGDATISQDVSIRPYIAKIVVSGEISEDDYRSEVLKKILVNDKIKAVIVAINSPGGTIVGSEIIYNELRNISLKKPMVVVMKSLAASGGYMASLASDHIIAHNGTLTGSIGVLMQSYEITGLAEKVGVKFQNYKSSVLKGSPSLFEKSNKSVDDAINQSIQDSYEFFADLVRQRRGVKLLSPLSLDGRVLTGRQALKLGLIDEIGGEENAIAYLQQKHNIDHSLSVVDISLEKKETDFVDKIIDSLPFAQKANSAFSNKGIMAIFQ